MKKVRGISFAAIFAIASFGHSQGFINLNFESANVSGYSPGSIPASNGIPGWIAYISGVSQNNILYNDASLGEAAVSLQDTNGIYPSIQAKYSILLQATFFAPDTNSAAIGQTGTVPTSAESLLFWANVNLSGVANNMQVTFNSNILSYVAIGSGGGYTAYGVDVSGFAGQTGQLLFTAYNNTYAKIDNIQFSSTPIPEPGTITLVALGMLLLGTRRSRNFRR
jgi:hypothetical protein